MEQTQFEAIVAEEFPNAIPEKFRTLIKNLVFLVEQEPSVDVRREEALNENETLLGFYRGIPRTARGNHYGVGATLPDTIVLYQLPIEAEAEHLQHTNKLKFVGMLYEQCVRKVVRDTIWHEVAHHFGFDERQVRAKEIDREKEK